MRDCRGTANIAHRAWAELRRLTTEAHMTGSRRTLCRALLAGWTFAHVLCTPVLAQAPDAGQAIVMDAVTRK
jgi:hypothetical protein